MSEYKQAAKGYAQRQVNIHRGGYAPTEVIHLIEQSYIAGAETATRNVLNAALEQFGDKTCGRT